MYLNGMPFIRSKLVIIIVTLACLLMTACGGGSSSDPERQSTATSPPKIQANILSFDANSDQGNIPNVAVSVVDSFTGADIITATVTVNEMSIAYNPAPGHNAYEGSINLAPGETILLKVTYEGTTYSASTTQFTAYPAISAPGNDTWYTKLPNTVRWTDGTPTYDAVYNIAFLDAENPYGNVIWPSNGIFQVLPTSTSSYYIYANTISVGARLLLTAIVKGVAIPGTATGSRLLVAGCSTKQIHVNDATIKSITVTPDSLTMAWGTQQQFSAIATFTDNTTLDVTQLVNWMAANFAVDMDYSTPGLARASYNGLATVTAYLEGFSDSASVTVLPPQLQSIQITPASRTIAPTTIQHFTASGNYEDGSVRDVTSLVTWNSSNQAVASINNEFGSNGQATAISAGTTTVTANLQGISQSAILSVADRPSFTGSYVYLQSDTGDYIGGGISSSFTSADAQFYTSVNGGHLSVTIIGNQSRSYGDFMLPNTLSTFQPGYYGNLTRYPFNDPALGGLNWDKDGRGCNMLIGSFTVDNVTYSSGRLSAIDLHFVQHCEYQSPALYGWMHLEP